MERFKRAMKIAAMMLSLCFVFAFSLTAQAAKYANGATYVNPQTNSKDEYVSVTKMRVSTYSTTSFDVIYPKGGAVTVSTNKKAVEAAVVSYDNFIDTQYYEDAAGNTLLDAAGNEVKYEYGKSTIQVTTTKAGDYKVTVNVNGVPTVVKVYVSPLGNTPVAKATFDGKEILSDKQKVKGSTITDTVKSNYKVDSKATAGKLKFTAQKGFKITGMVVASADKDSKAVYKAKKNGAKITLSKSYGSVAKNTDGSSYRAPRKLTKVYVSYKDKKLGTSVKYSVTKKHGVKQIKCVTKTVIGDKYVSYTDYENGSAGDSLNSYYGNSGSAFTLWAY